MENQNEGLKRALGVLDVATNVINISIGSGIFLLPALIAGILGNTSIIAYALCGFMFLLVALCYAEVGSRISSSGGAYAYIEKAFGPYIGFLANGFFWFGTGVLVTAALLNGIADMLSVPFPVFSTPPEGIGMFHQYRTLLFVILLSFLTFVNIRGVTQSITTIKMVTLIKVLPLVLVVLVGLFRLKISNLAFDTLPSMDKLGEASLILFFAFTGGETALVTSGEMKNPNRTAPLGLLFGIIPIVLFYCLIQIIAQSTLGADLIGQKAPLAAVAGALFGSWGSSLLIACAVLAIFGTLNSIVLVYPRVVFAGAKDGLLPAVLAKIHPRYATPHWAIVTFIAISFVMAISGGFKQLLVLATLSMLLLHVGVAAAAIRFRLKPDAAYPAKFKLSGGVTIPAVALVILIWFILQSKTNEFMAMGWFFGILSFIYVLKVFVFKPKAQGQP
jgi:basic amino acid/polyamine antiporter, APA family